MLTSSTTSEAPGARGVPRVWAGALACLLVLAFTLGDAFARGGQGGRGGGFERPSGPSRGAGFQGTAPPRGSFGQADVNRTVNNVNVDRNANVNVNRSANVNVNNNWNRPGPRPVPPPPPPVVVPVPAPVYGYGYNSGYGAGVAAGVVAGAMLTILPATAVMIANQSSGPVYRADTKCYREVYANGGVAYQPIPCP